jgi:hypothetical protein
MKNKRSCRPKSKKRKRRIGRDAGNAGVGAAPRQPSPPWRLPRSV